MQPLGKGIRKEDVEENPGTETARRPGKEAQGKTVKSNSGRLEAAEARTKRKLREQIVRPAEKKALSVLQVVKLKVKAEQGASQVKFSKEITRRKTMRVPGKAENRKMESRSDQEQLPPGRNPQGNPKESRKLQL
jgi:hypothetical protein